MQQALHLHKEHQFCSGLFWRVIFSPLSYPPFFLVSECPSIGTKFSFLLSCATLSSVVIRMYMPLNQESSVNCMSLHEQESHGSGENITNIEWSLCTAAISKQPTWSFLLELLLYYLSSWQIGQQELYSEWIPSLTFHQKYSCFVQFLCD